MRRIYNTLLLFGVLICNTALAQSDSLSRAMIARGGELRDKVTTIEQKLSTLRTEYGTADVDRRKELSTEIIAAEGVLFESQRELSTIEREYGVAPTATEQQPQEREEATATEPDNTKWISRSRIIEEQLSDHDYTMMRECDEKERRSYRLYKNFRSLYKNLEALRDQYNNASDFKVAQGYVAEFDSLLLISDSLSKGLIHNWSNIYDEKQLLYTLLGETTNSNLLLTTIDSLSVAVNSSVMDIDESVEYTGVAEYELLKSSMLKMEEAVALEFNIKKGVDSLRRAWVRFNDSLMFSLAPVRIVERSFIDYQTIRFAKESIYNSSNPIPRLKIYDYGTIYRILLGTYSKPQSGALYKGAYPLMYRPIGSYFAYYAGGYATELEAQQASTELKQMGFRRADIVVWIDGEFRNITMNPFPKRDVRVIMSGVEVLPEQVIEKINSIKGGAELTRIGKDRYVITPITESAELSAAIVEIKKLAPQLEVTVTEIKQ